MIRTKRVQRDVALITYAKPIIRRSFSSINFDRAANANATVSGVRVGRYERLFCDNRSTSGAQTRKKVKEERKAERRRLTVNATCIFKTLEFHPIALSLKAKVRGMTNREAIDSSHLFFVEITRRVDLSVYFREFSHRREPLRREGSSKN